MKMIKIKLKNFKEVGVLLVNTLDDSKIEQRKRNIKSVLMMNGIRQKDMAKRMGISETQFSAKVNGFSSFKEREINIFLKEVGRAYEDIFLV